MVTTNDLRKFINSLNYIALLDKTISDLNLTVSDEEPPSQMFNIEADGINKSCLTLKDLEDFCIQNKEKIVKFVNLKLNQIKDDKDEYNKKGDKDIIIETLPFYKTFLIGHIIELFYLANKPHELINYLNKIKILKAKKYLNQLNEIYKEL